MSFYIFFSTVMITGLGFGLENTGLGLEDYWPWPRTCCPRTHPCYCVAYLVCICWDTSNARNGKVERRQLVAGRTHEWNQKSTETTVNMDWNWITNAQLQHNPYNVYTVSQKTHHIFNDNVNKNCLTIIIFGPLIIQLTDHWKLVSSSQLSYSQQRDKKQIAVKKINSIKNFKAGKNMHVSGANSEHKHPALERFSSLSKRLISQNSKDSVTVNCQ